MKGKNVKYFKLFRVENKLYKLRNKRKKFEDYVLRILLTIYFFSHYLVLWFLVSIFFFLVSYLMFILEIVKYNLKMIFR